MEVLGTPLASPFVLCPIGVLEMAHRDADVAVARAAAAEGIPFVFSNQASRPMEETARAMGDAPRWFQLYWSTSNELVESLVSRAERCGCRAIVLTLDTTMLGWRIRDLDLAYLPFLRGKGIAQYTSDPVFVEALQETLRQEPPPSGRITLAAIGTLLSQAGAYPGSRLANVRSGLARAAVRRFVETYSRPSLSWDDLAFLRERTRLPILLKGILHPADALAAIEHGMDGHRRLEPRRAPGRRRDRDDGRAPGDRRRRRRAQSRSSSTAAFAPAPTSSARSRSAPRRSGSAAPTCGGSRRAARTACARSSGTSAPTSTSRWASPASPRRARSGATT